MDIAKTFGTNKTKEEQGVWVDGPDGARFLVARQGNTAFRKLSAELAKPHRRLFQMGKVDDAIIKGITAEVIARTVLLDWKGVKAGEKELAYTPEIGKEMLLKHEDFADFITGISTTVSLFQDELDQAAAGN